MERMAVLVLSLLFAAALGLSAAGAGSPVQSPYATWRNGPPTEPTFFPLAVWCQDPKNAAAFKELGINTYVALWRGPTEEQLEQLRKVGMRVICDQNEVGLRHVNDPLIIGWMHGDEPDNCQPDGKGGWGAPIPPARIVADYHEMRGRDPSRPILLNLGQGVANDEYKGTWTALSEYPEYIRGADMVSFDIYPMAGRQEIQGLDWLWAVGKGVSRLVRWSEGRKVVWNAVECTQISAPGHKPTPDQVRSEVWMSIIHGSMGIIYFVHQFEPTFIEAGLLADPEMSAAVKALNAQITALAPVLNTPSLPDAATITADNPLVPVEFMVKRHEGSLYLFAISMRNLPTHARLTFSAWRKARRNAEVTVVGENRTLPSWNGRFEDDFEPYQVHIYRVPEP